MKSTFILAAALALSLATLAPGQSNTVNGKGGGITDQNAFLNALGGTTAGKALFQMPNPSAIRFPRINADNSVSLLSDADFRGAIGAGTVTNEAMNDAIATNPGATRAALEINGVVVSKKDGTRKGFTPSADTDAARGLALEAAFAAAVAGDTIDLSPGSYYVAKSTSTIAGIVAQFAILDKMTIRLNGAYLWKQNTDTASCMFSCNAASGINDWSIIGPGTLEGSYIDTANTTGARGSAAAEIGVNVTASRRWKIDGVTFKNFAGSNIQLNNATFVSDEYLTSSLVYKVSTGHISNCNIDLGNVGVYIGTGNEFNVFTNCTFTKNQTAIDLYAGNTQFIGCHAELNVNFALRIRNGGNDGHGSWVGGSFAHNLGFAIAAEASMDNGFVFSGTHFFADNTSNNKIQSLGGGLIFNGCEIDAPFFASGTPTGINSVTGCFFPISVISAANAVSDLSAAERLQWVFAENHTLVGPYANNDTQAYVYADNAAAVLGGLTAGRKYRTSTGEIRIVVP
jgi:hypothetical protein